MINLTVLEIVNSIWILTSLKKNIYCFPLDFLDSKEDIAETQVKTTLANDATNHAQRQNPYNHRSHKVAHLGHTLICAKRVKRARVSQV